MVSERQREHAAVRRNPPDGWGLLFAWVPGRSSKVRCLLCGATGYGGCGKWTTDVAPWQIPHILGHPVQCITCRRPFISFRAVRSHQTCKLHHACCRDHTSVAPWKNPFTGAAP